MHPTINIANICTNSITSFLVFTVVILNSLTVRLLHDAKVGLVQVLPYDYIYNFMIYINNGSNDSEFNFAFRDVLTLSQLCNYSSCQNKISYQIRK